MACRPRVMRNERRYLTALEQTRSYTLERLTLILRNGRGQVLLSLRRGDFD